MDYPSERKEKTLNESELKTKCKLDLSKSALGPIFILTHKQVAAFTTAVCSYVKCKLLCEDITYPAQTDRQKLLSGTHWSPKHI